MNNDYRYEQEFHRCWNFPVFMHYLSSLAEMVVERNVGIFFFAPCWRRKHIRVLNNYERKITTEICAILHQLDHAEDNSHPSTPNTRALIQFLFSPLKGDLGTYQASTFLCLRFTSLSQRSIIHTS